MNTILKVEIFAQKMNEILPALAHIGGVFLTEDSRNPSYYIKMSYKLSKTDELKAVIRFVKDYEKTIASKQDSVN